MFEKSYEPVLAEVKLSAAAVSPEEIVQWGCKLKEATPSVVVILQSAPSKVPPLNNISVITTPDVFNALPFVSKRRTFPVIWLDDGYVKIT